MLGALQSLVKAPQSPILQPPGAGLPWLEMLYAQSGFWLARRAMSRELALDRFVGEAHRIEALVLRQTPATAECPVLIPRIFGIEDSSRNWSLFMTVEHLIIVDTAIISILEHLTAGKTLGTTISTALVKPAPGQDGTVMRRFSETVFHYSKTLSTLPSLHTSTLQTHPWFGPLDAHGWHCLAAIHHKIHRRQIENIIRLISCED